MRVKENFIFQDYNEYWYFARFLSKKQRRIIFYNLSQEQKKILDNSFLRDGWSDLVNKNEIDEKIDIIKKRYKYDIIDLRIKAKKGKSVYVSSKEWDQVEKIFSGYKKEDVEVVLGGLVREKCKNNPEVSLITYNNK